MTKQYQLPKEFAERWVAALRSGEYKQTTGKLKDNVGYCCLGVGCIVNNIDPNRLFGETYPKISWLPGDSFYSANYNGRAETLEILLAKMNDHDNYSFSEIADWIEANVEFTDKEAQNV